MIEVVVYGNHLLPMKCEDNTMLPAFDVHTVRWHASVQKLGAADSGWFFLVHVSGSETTSPV